jgi:hypothetical protein
MQVDDNGNLKNTDTKLNLGNSGEIALSGSAQVLTLLGAICAAPLGVALTAIGAGTTVILSAWQIEQQKKLIEEISKALASIDKAQLNKDFLESSEFREIVMRICNDASLTASPYKHSALAKGLVHSAIYPQNEMTGKLIFIRIVSQMSDEELRILEVMQNAWEDNVPILGENDLQWSLKDLELGQIQVSCDGLIQQRVLEPINSEAWSLSILGRKLVAWLSGKQEQENFEVFQKSCIAQLKKAIDSDREAIISEALIRGSREQARQALQRAGL